MNAASSYPAGALGDHIGKRGLLAAGYLIATITFAAFILEPPTLHVLIVLFGLAGIHSGVQQSLEKSLAAEFLPQSIRGSGFGVLATVNGIGDFVSSIVVGALWSAVSPAAGFLYAAIFTGFGAALIYFFTPAARSEIRCTRQLQGRFVLIFLFCFLEETCEPSRRCRSPL